jgi:malonyl-CoA O-methyltransferase
MASSIKAIEHRETAGTWGFGRRLIDYIKRAIVAHTQGARSASGPHCAIQWLRNNELNSGGIRVHDSHANAYPEVTGYLVPTMLAYGEKEMARRSVQWLVRIQHDDGSYLDPDGGIPYIFDTGQVLRGLLAGSGLVPEAHEAARRASDWLLGKMINGGRDGFPHAYDGLDHVPESVQLYVLPALRQAAVVFGNPAYRETADRCLEYYINQRYLLDIDRTLSHFLAYEIEALIDLGRPDLVARVLDKLESLQHSDGSVRGIGGVRWVCTPGLLQIAICWYKTGRHDAADRAIKWVESRQQKSGGFLGSHGRNAWYFPRNELSWASKYYLDANLLRVRIFFDLNAGIFPQYVAEDDGRLGAILSAVRSGDSVLEVGCGKGRFISAVSKIKADVHCTAVDISAALLQYVPERIEKKEGSLEAIPLPDNRFDVAFSVEAIEHSANPEAAIREMIRVVRPGGRVIIIDKQRSHWGRLKCTSWERWPDLNELASLLKRGCIDVSATPVSYDGHPDSDGLMVAWSGRKDVGTKP